MANVIAALDQGTTSTRCILFDKDGNPISSSQREHQQIFPQPGWVEHNPIEIWENSLHVIQKSIDQAGLNTADLAGLGITNQRETIVAWSRSTGKPFCNALVWQDTRTDQICQQLAGQVGQDRYRDKVGLPLSTYFSGPKMIWILKEIPLAQKMAEEGDLLFGTIDSWIIWNLTGGSDGGKHITDVTNASRTMLMNLSTLDWDEEILADFEIPLSSLPKICSSSQVYGSAKGALTGMKIAGILGDQQAALFGQTCFNPGDAKNTYGTGCFLLMNNGKKPTSSKHGLLTTLAYKIDDQDAIYALEGSVAITGALVQWLRDNLGIIENTADIETLALQVEDNGGIYFVPAFSGLFAPYWRSDARGVIAGLTRFITKAHLARAVLEATAYQTREILEAMEKDSEITLNSLKVDGGMVQNNLLMAFQADILNVPVIRPTITETTALGAAYAAGLAVGIWKDLTDLKEYWVEDKRWEPNMVDEVREGYFRSWKKAVERSMNWTEKD
jgi:glycerol kinase